MTFPNTSMIFVSDVNPPAKASAPGRLYVKFTAPEGIWVSIPTVANANLFVWKAYASGGGGGSGLGTSAVQSLIDASIVDFLTSSAITALIRASHSQTLSSSAIQVLIDNSISGFLDATAISTLISSEVSNYLTSAGVQSLIDSSTSSFISSTEIMGLISTAISDFLTSTEVQSLIDSSVSTFLSTTEIQTLINNSKPSWSLGFVPTVADAKKLVQIIDDGGAAKLGVITRSALWDSIRPTYLKGFNPTASDYDKILSIAQSSEGPVIVPIFDVPPETETSNVAFIRLDRISVKTAAIGVYRFLSRTSGRSEKGDIVGALKSHPIDLIVMTFNDTADTATLTIRSSEKTLYDKIAKIKTWFKSPTATKELTPVKSGVSVTDTATAVTRKMYLLSVTGVTWSDSDGGIIDSAKTNIRDGNDFSDSLVIGLGFLNASNSPLDFTREVGGVDSAFRERGLIPEKSSNNNEIGKLAVAEISTPATGGLPAKTGLKYYRPHDLGIKSYASAVLFLDAPRASNGRPDFLKRNTAVDNKMIIAAGVKGRVHGEEFILPNAVNASILTNPRSGVRWECTVALPANNTEEDRTYMGESDYIPNNGDVGTLVVSGMGELLKAERGTYQIFSHPAPNNQTAYLRAFVESSTKLTLVNRGVFASYENDSHTAFPVGSTVKLTAMLIGYIFVGRAFFSETFVSYSHPIRGNTPRPQNKRSINDVWISPYSGGERVRVWDGTKWETHGIMEVGRASFKTQRSAVFDTIDFTEPVGRLNTLRFRIQNIETISLISPGRIHVGGNHFFFDTMDFTILGDALAAFRSSRNLTFYGVVTPSGGKLMTINRPKWDPLRQYNVDWFSKGRVVFKVHLNSVGSFIYNDRQNLDISVIFNSQQKIPTSFTVIMDTDSSIVSSTLPEVSGGRRGVGRYTLTLPPLFFTKPPIFEIQAVSTYAQVVQLETVSSSNCTFGTNSVAADGTLSARDMKTQITITMQGRDFEQANLFNSLI